MQNEINMSFQLWLLLQAPSKHIYVWINQCDGKRWGKLIPGGKLDTTCSCSSSRAVCSSYLTLWSLKFKHFIVCVFHLPPTKLPQEGQKERTEDTREEINPPSPPARRVCVCVCDVDVVEAIVRLRPHPTVGGSVAVMGVSARWNKHWYLFSHR